MILPSHKKSTALWIVGVIILLAGGAWLASFYKPATPQPRAVEPQGSSPRVIPSVVDGMRVYRSQLLRFEVSYPEDLIVREYGKANTSTVTFEDQKGERGFQIFVVPYSEATVSDKRFKMDVPSGVMKDPIEVVVGGATATMFWSTNSLFGETREVWFIHNGFLYEVTTYKDLDSWLASIMQTWKFI